MAMTKNYIVEQIIKRVGFSHKQSSDLVENLLEIIKRAMEKGDDVLISNFGKFQVKGKGVRKGRNPATGSEMELPARRVVTFKSSAILREKINNTPNKRKKK